MPANVRWTHDDVQTGLSFPDGYFDVIHGRFLLFGVSFMLQCTDGVLIAPDTRLASRHTRMRATAAPRGDRRLRGNRHAHDPTWRVGSKRP